MSDRIGTLAATYHITGDPDEVRAEAVRRLRDLVVPAPELLQLDAYHVAAVVALVQDAKVVTGS